MTAKLTAKQRRELDSARKHLTAAIVRIDSVRAGLNEHAMRDYWTWSQLNRAADSIERERDGIADLLSQDVS